ncbi:right-handed parallel beta-helix repeat-containing protein [Candidatus Desantisbacteria bacterium]|nr:right-handed parallel beta-helix repeat-containing protein [Candidatus Desantisbacteria bacterium]
MRYIYYPLLIALSILISQIKIAAGAEEGRLDIISHDTTWSGNIFLDNGILLEKGKTLTITPGTTIILKRLPANKNNPVMRIEGNIKAIGTPDRIIEFNGVTGLPMSWDGIYFFDSSESEISYSKILNSSTAVTCEKSSPVLTNNTLANNITGIKIIKECNPVIKENIIKNNMYGITCDEGGAPLVIKNLFEENNESGLTFKEGSNPSILENTFNKNNIGIFSGHSPGSPIISFNIFTENKYGLKFAQNTTLEIDNCIFMKNEFGIYGEMSTHLHIINCLFKQNNTAISGKLKTFNLVEFCDIIENKIGISLYILSDHEIIHNNIYDNEIGIELVVSVPKIEWNNFNNFKYNIKLHKLSDESYKKRKDPRGKLNFKFNWWGTAALKEIKESKKNLSTFYDYYDLPLDIDQGTMCHEDEIGYENWQENKIDNAGIKENIKQELKEKNMKIIQQKLWRINPNKLKKENFNFNN